VPAVPASRLDRVPAGLLVLMAIASVQTGSAVARTLFDELGAAGATLLRLLLSALLLLAVLRPRVAAMVAPSSGRPPACSARPWRR
jgi:threonine/homoserine efflux transporter RhtA